MKRLPLHLALIIFAYLTPTLLCLIGDKVISGEQIHNAADDHHLDPDTGKILHRRVVRKENYLHVTLRNMDIAINKSEYFVLFVFGDWCEFSKQHEKTFKTFAKYHHKIHSKLLFGSLHIAKKEQFTFAEVVSNPTIFLYHHGTLVKRFDFLKQKVQILNMRPKILSAFEPFLLSNISDRKHVKHIIDSYERFLVFVSDKNIPMRDLERAIKDDDVLNKSTEMPMVDLPGQDEAKEDLPALDQQTVVLGNFLLMSDMRLETHMKYFNLNNVDALQEFFPEHKIAPGHVYLYRKGDRSLLRMENMELRSMINWFTVKTWLYHHMHLDVLAFPEPAMKRIVKDHNIGLFLFLHGKESVEGRGILSPNEQAESELDLVAKKYYK